MSEEKNELIKRRFEELEEIKKLGINPYPHKYDVTSNSEEIIAGFIDPESDEEKEKRKEIIVSVAGRISAIRKMGKATFCHIKDDKGKKKMIHFFGDKHDLNNLCNQSLKCMKNKNSPKSNCYDFIYRMFYKGGGG